MTRLLKDYYAFYRLFFNTVSLVLLVLLIDYSAGFNDVQIISYPPVLDILRTAFMYSSLVFFAWAFLFDYDPWSFFGIRQILTFRQKHITMRTAVQASAPVLKKSGLLGIVRHPMYLALIVFLWTQTFYLIDILVNLILTVYVIIGTKLEEKKLILEFGEQYIEYQHEVPMLIPFTKPNPPKYQFR